jgi:hypothetical protein
MKRRVGSWLVVMACAWLAPLGCSSILGIKDVPPGGDGGGESDGTTSDAPGQPDGNGGQEASADSGGQDVVTTPHDGSAPDGTTGLDASDAADTSSKPDAEAGGPVVCVFGSLFGSGCVFAP